MYNVPCKVIQYWVYLDRNSFKWISIFFQNLPRVKFFVATYRSRYNTIRVVLSLIFYWIKLYNFIKSEIVFERSRNFDRWRWYLIQVLQRIKFLIWRWIVFFIFFNDPFTTCFLSWLGGCNWPYLSKKHYKITHFKKLKHRHPIISGQ